MDQDTIEKLCILEDLNKRFLIRIKNKNRNRNIEYFRFNDKRTI